MYRGFALKTQVRRKVSRSANVALGLAFIGITVFAVFVTFSRTGSPAYSAKVQRDFVRIEGINDFVGLAHTYAYPAGSKVQKKDLPEEPSPSILSEERYKSFIDPLTHEHYKYKKTGPSTYEITVTFELGTNDLEKRGHLLDRRFTHNKGEHTFKFSAKDKADLYDY